MKKILIMMTAVIWTLLTMSVPVNAAETSTTVAGSVLKADVDMEVHQEADETSEVTAVLEAGTVVLVTDVDAGEGWCRISVKETTGYVRTGHLVPLVSSEEMELEFEQIGNNYHMVFNEVEQLEKQVAKHNNLIERTYRLEERTELQEEKIKVANHRIDDLERKVET